MPPATLDATRREWEEGYRRLESASGDRQRYASLLAELELVLDELRRRIGQTFTLDELAAAYAGADRWVQDALAEHDPAPGWPTRQITVQDAAFHVYSRGAVDYRP
jgi:alcohol dehydrogenase class IV